VIAVALALLLALLVERIVRQRSSGIVRVNEALTAVAKGELNQRVELRSSDDARSMADNLNILAERMRAQYAREAEARQFESFFRLSAMLTHDLKNAIEALSLIVSNMERHFHNEQFRVDAMRSLTSATNKLRALVARLSRPVTSLSGEHKLPRRTNIAPILQRAVKETAQPSADRHTLEVNLPSELFAVVDIDHIHEVFENLILNALEAMTEKRGTLTIAAEKTPQGKALITISDTGCGMSKTFLQENLFRPFRTTKNAGVGLGLYTCREVIVASGGTIEVDSAEGVGTTFRVVLPSETG
jgi:putative PEP-CTERM system histidine kinase